MRPTRRIRFDMLSSPSTIEPLSWCLARSSIRALTAVSADAQPGRWALEWPNTDFERSSVDFNDILDGGPPRDGIPAISDPDFVPVAEDSLIEFDGLTPQMIEVLAKDGLKTLEDFATCADWELAGGWTMVDGERVKDEGVLEKFDVSLEEAQDLVMTARVMLGWVDPEELAASASEDEEGEAAEEAEV